MGAGAGPELRARLTLDDEPFKKKLGGATGHAEGFTKRLESLFKRHPGARAEHALTGFIEDLSSGNVQGAISGITSKIGGLGLAAGVGIGAALAVFQKAKEEIDATDKAVAKLQTSLAQRPESLQRLLGAEGIEKEAAQQEALLNDVVEKRKGFWQKLREAAIAGQPDYQGDPKEIGSAKPDRVPEALKAQISGEQRIKQLALDRASAELDSVKAKDISLHKGEQEAQLFKLHLDTQKKIAQIGIESGPTKAGRDLLVYFQRIQAARYEEKLSADEIKNKTTLKRLELDLEEKINSIARSGMSVEGQKIQAIRERISTLRKEAEIENDPLKKREISNKINALDTQQGRAEFDQRNAPGSALYTPERANEAAFQSFLKERERTQGLKNPHFDIGGRLIGGTDSVTGENKNFEKSPFDSGFFVGKEQMIGGKQFAVQAIKRDRAQQRSEIPTGLGLMKLQNFDENAGRDIANFGKGSFMESRNGVGEDSLRKESGIGVDSLKAEIVGLRSDLRSYWGD